MKFYHSLPLQIRFNDIDLAQHVNNSVYQEFFDLGRLGYFKTVMNESLRFDGISMVIASFRVDFYQPVFLDDEVFVETKVVALGTKSFEMAQRVVRKGESEPKAQATSTMVCFDYARQASSEIPESWRQKIAEFERYEVRKKKS